MMNLKRTTNPNGCCIYIRALIIVTVFHLAPSQGSSQGDVRIDGGHSAGRVEVYINGTWGSICDQQWTLREANVVCRQLGYPAGAVSAYSSSAYGNKKDPAFYVDVNCPASGTRILQCAVSGSRACVLPSGSAGIRCDTASGASSGDLRLAGSRVPWVGRVEIFHNGTWGTVCDDSWGRADADVVCRQLGFPNSLQAYSMAVFGQGKGPIWLTNLRCNGNESRLETCPFYGWGIHSCSHAEDGGVACSQLVARKQGNCDFNNDPSSTCGYTNEKGDDFDWAVRQGRTPSYSTGPNQDHTAGSTGGSSSGYYLYIETSSPRRQGDVARIVSPLVPYGRCVEFYYNMFGATIGDLNIYLEYQGQAEIKEWRLSGQQSSRSDWKHGLIPVKNRIPFKIVFEGIRGASYTGDIAIDDISILNTSCSVLPPKAEPKLIDITNITRNVRLAGTNSSSMGRVEILHNGRWGTVCRNGFNMKAANVVCRQLGFTEGAESVVRCCRMFSAGDGFMWLGGVTCEGREAALSKCPHPGWGRSSCYRTQVAGVLCKSNDTLREVRLAGSGNNWEGRVEVKINGMWGTINAAEWDIYDATVVCKQLGFSGASAVYNRGDHYPGGPRRHWISNVRCNGDETALWNCNMTTLSLLSFYYGSSQTAGAVCYKLKLTGGRDGSEGRVEIQYEGYWGTICNMDWDLNDANVVCRQLGYYKAKSIHTSSPLGATVNTVPRLTRVRCNGDEPALGLCAYQDLHGVKHHCNHTHDAQVVCQKYQPTGAPSTTVSTATTQKPSSRATSVPTTSNQQPPTTTKGPSTVCPSCPKDSCYITTPGHTPVCICPEGSTKHYTCDATVGKDVIEVTVETSMAKWNAVSFKKSLSNVLNQFCSSEGSSCGLRNGTKYHFESSDIILLKGYPHSTPESSSLHLRFIVILRYLNGSVALLPTQVVKNLIQKQKTIASYIIHVYSEPRSHQRKGGGGSLSSKLEVILPVVIVALLGIAVVVLVVMKIRKRRRTNSAVPHSFRRLLTDDEDDNAGADDDDLPIEI